MNMKERFRISRLVSWLADGFFNLVDPLPEPCGFCAEPASFPGTSLCTKCLVQIPRVVAPLCSLCGRPVRGTLSRQAICPECRATAPRFVRARAVGVYDGLLREAIHGLKFGGRVGAVRALGELLGETIRADRVLRRCRVTIPVPLHPERFFERGYNQAELLSQHVSIQLRLRHGPHALRRIRPTAGQSGLSSGERRDNVRNAFQCMTPAAVAGQHVLLVDDVLTTGHTASECTRALLKGGALSVCLATVAVAPLESCWHHRTE